MIKRYVSEVYLTYDSDDAGTRAALRAVPIMREAGIAAKVIRMDPYKDPDEFIKNLGAEEFEKRIENARNGFMFSLEILSKNYDMESPEEKTAFFQETAKRLIEFEDELERNNYIEAVAKAYRVNPDSLQKLVTKTAIKEGLASPTKRPKNLNQNKDLVSKKEDGNKRAQKILLTWLIDQPKLFQIIEEYVTPEDFTETNYQKVAELLYEQYHLGELNPARILNHFTEEEEHREVAALFNTRIRELTTEKEKDRAIKETIIKVKNNSIDHQTMNLNPTDMVGLQRLMESKRKLQNIGKLHISLD